MLYILDCLNIIAPSVSDVSWLVVSPLILGPVLAILRFFIIRSLWPVSGWQLLHLYVCLDGEVTLHDRIIITLKAACVEI